MGQNNTTTTQPTVTPTTQQTEQPTEQPNETIAGSSDYVALDEAYAGMETMFPATTDYTAKSNITYSYMSIASGYGEDNIGTATANARLNDPNISKQIFLENDSLSDRLIFDLPDWGVEDYISDRTKWQKGIRSIGDEQGWFYFKVFFKFDTNFGLFGGVLNPENVMQSTCALRYLNTIKTLYKAEQIPMRINALIKFTSILSKINTKYPWLIKGLNEFSKVMNLNVDNFSEEKSFELVLNTETTDMKISNLLNLYKLACYDDINCKEIIPENLRKFDMMVVFYQMPIKYFQTAIMVSPKRDVSTGIFKPGTKLAKTEEIINKSFNFLTTKSTYYKYKRMSPDNGNFSNMMSFNMFTFHNCEINKESFQKYFDGAELKNEQAFQFGETAIKIDYERVYYHSMNEWTQMLFGSDGFYYDTNFADGSKLDSSIINRIRGNSLTNFASERLKSIRSAHHGSTFFDKNAEQYKSLIDFSESVITDGLMNMDMKDYYAFLKGNLYGNVGVESEYFAEKMKVLHEGIISGNLYGVGEELKKFNNGEESYFRKKIRAIKEGTISDGHLYGTGEELKKFNSKNKDNYFSRKIQAIKEGTISDGHLYGIGEELKKFNNGEEGYFSKKIQAIKEGTISDGNLYGIGEELKKLNNGEESYFTRKLQAIKEGTISGNIYNDYKYKQLKFDLEKERLGFKEKDIEYKQSKHNLETERLGFEGKDIEYKQSKSDLEKERLGFEGKDGKPKDLKTNLENERLAFKPTFNVDQEKKQKIDIWQYILNNFGYSKLKGNDSGLLGDVKNTINNGASFFRWKL